jgi:TRAP-type mannitol/chloroaromatic compound transport system permease large subunit
VLVLGTIYGGVATVTEAAGLGALGALAIALSRRELDLAQLRAALTQTLITCGNLIWLTFGATALIGAYNLLGGTHYLQGLFAGMDLPPMGIILVMVAILLVLGCFMDWIGICLLVMPVFVPVVRTLGYDPVWFGIVFCVAMQIAYVSPPFGPSCFYLKGVAPPDVTLAEIFRSVIPFIGLQLAVLAFLLAVPDLALFLPAAAR